MPTKGEYRHTTDENGNTVYQRYAVNSEGKGKWFTVKEPEQKPFKEENIANRRARYAKDRNMAASRAEARELYRRGPAAKYRMEAAKDVGFLPSVGMAAGREIEKMGAGAYDIYNFLEDLVTPGGSESAMARTRELEQTQKDRDVMFQEFEDANPGANVVGKTLPYLATGATAGVKAEAKAAELVSDTVKYGKMAVTRPSKAMAKRIRSQAARRKVSERRTNLPRTKTEKAIEATKDARIDANRWAEEKIVKPIAEKAEARANRPPIEDYFRKGAIGGTVAAMGLGALEGGLHYDESAIDGIISSALGYMGGRTLAPIFSKGPVENTAAERQMLKEWEQEGFRLDPGMQSGRPDLQVKHGDARRNPKYRNYIAQVDKANDLVVARRAARAMGMDLGEFLELTTDRLRAYKKSLSDEYQQLEARSGGVMDRGDVNRATQEIADLLQHQPAGTINHVHNIWDSIATMRNFTGSDYQGKIRVLNDAADSALRNGKMEQYKAFIRMKKVLDEGMARGVGRRYGPEMANKWRDLNERYAMTSLVEDKGFDANFRIDQSKLSQHLMSNDAQRLLEGTGGRVKDLHAIARLNRYQQRQQKPTLGEGGAGMEDTLPAPSKRMLSTPQDAKIPLRRKARLNLYYSGWPNNTGLFNLPIEGPYSFPNISRAYTQAMDPEVTAMEHAQQIYENPTNYVTDKWNRMKTLMGY